MSEPTKPEPELPTFKATVEAGVVKVSAADAFRLVYPMTSAMSNVEIGLAVLAFASLLTDGRQAGRDALVEFCARGLAGLLSELEKRGLTLEQAMKLGRNDLAERTLAAAMQPPKPASGVN